VALSDDPEKIVEEYVHNRLVRAAYTTLKDQHYTAEAIAECE
jgi:hypothetical protein